MGGAKGIGYEDWSAFCTQMAQFVNLVSKVSALEMLEDQTDNRKLKGVIRSLLLDVKKGDTISGAIYKREKDFPPVMRYAISGITTDKGMKEAWEKLGEMFASLYELEEAKRRSFFYPFIVMMTALVSVLVLIVFILPRIIGMFAGIDFKLPTFTRIVLDACNLVKEYYIIVIICVLFFALLWWLFRKLPIGAFAASVLRLNLPSVKRMNRNYVYARVSLIMATLLEMKMPRGRVIAVVADSMGDYEAIRSDLYEVGGKLEEGCSFAKSLEESFFFSPMFLNMTAIGEETGDLTGSVRSLADYYSNRFLHEAGKTITRLETISVIIMAVLVLILLGALISPMMDYFELINGKM